MYYEDYKLHELNQVATDFLKENYDLPLAIPIKINGRLTRTLGYYKYTTSNKPIEISLARRLVRYGHDDIIIDILKHELIHYALHILGKPCKDGQPYFENELIKHKVSSTNFYNSIGERFFIECSSCKKESWTDRKSVINKIDQYHSKCCKTKLSYNKSAIYNGYELIGK